jgi:formate dehydrogenase maturation protein FdhE
MSHPEMDAKKEQAFVTIRDALFSLPETDDVLEKTGHMLDVLEQMLARVIAGSAFEKEHIDEMCDQSRENIHEMALQFLEEDLQNPENTES